MFNLTPAAARQIQRAAIDTGAEQLVLRIAAKVENDGSLHYGMGFDEPSEQDLKLLIEGVAVVIGHESQELLEETTLDFVELEPGTFHFIFADNRDTDLHAGAPSGCGSGCAGGSCGTSGACH